MPTVLAIAIGGAIGALGRHYVSAFVTKGAGSGFPFGTMTVNMLGSFLMGVLITAFALKFEGSPALRSFLTVGLLGSFTTFSTYSLETMLLIERGAWQSAAVYALGSMVVGVMALSLGLFIGKALA